MLSVAALCGTVAAPSATFAQSTFAIDDLPELGPLPSATRGQSPDDIELSDEGPRDPEPEIVTPVEPIPEIVLPPIRAVEMPRFWDPRLRRRKPDLSGRQRVRFLMAPNFEPFAGLDAQGRPQGYHVELVRGLCDALEITAKCQVQMLPWAQLRGALARGDGDAIMAGLAIDAGARRELAFTESYMRFPARFATRTDGGFVPDQDGARVGVVGGSAHEAMLRSLFPSSSAVPFADDDALRAALERAEVEVIFTDGMTTAQWLAAGGGSGCCELVGQPYFSDYYLGRGLSVATRAEDTELVEALDWALSTLSAQGTLEEVYLRTFPISFY